MLQILLLLLATHAAERVVTLEDALGRALEQNPEVIALRAELEARDAEVDQAARLVNPELTSAVEHVGTDASERETTTSVEQIVELGGDRRARRDVAATTRDLARFDYASKRVEIAARVRSAFAGVLAGQERLAIARENLKLVQDAAGAIRERVAAGKVSPIEETRAAVAVATERLALRRAETELELARRRLAAAWGSDTSDFDSVAGALGVRELPPPEMLHAALERHPDLARWTSEIAEREAVVRLEQARSVPDLRASVGHRTYESADDAALVGGIAIPLPLFDRNRGAIAAARLRVERAREEQRAARVRLQREADEAHRRAATVAGEVETLRTEIVPAAQSVYDAIAEGYRLGKFGYLEVLDARRVLADARLQLVRALEELELARVEIDRLMGVER